MKKIMKKNKRISIQIGSVVTLLFFVTISLITIVVYWGTKDLFLSTWNENMTYDLQKFKDLHMNEEITGMDEIAYEYKDGKNILTLKKNIIREGHVSRLSGKPCAVYAIKRIFFVFGSSHSIYRMGQT